jgi:CheY-like chemotaxis protein
MTAGQRILIVDDETKVAFFLQESLKALDKDLEVLSVTSAEAALWEIEQEAVDLLVTDQRMPGLSGIELITKVRQRHPDTQTILITAYGTDQVANEAKRLQVHHYFTKPFHIEDFVQTALEALHSTNDPPAANRLSSQCADAVSHRLESLRREIGAQCVIAATSTGESVAQAGATVGLHVEPLLSLVADGFAASSALALHLGGDHMTNLNYYEGAVYDLYLAHIDDDLILSIIFDRRIQASRIGIVWLYARRAIEALRRILVAPRQTKTTVGLSLDSALPGQSSAPLSPMTKQSPINA